MQLCPATRELRTVGITPNRLIEPNTPSLRPARPPKGDVRAWARGKAPSACHFQEERLEARQMHAMATVPQLRDPSTSAAAEAWISQASRAATGAEAAAPTRRPRSKPTKARSAAPARRALAAAVASASAPPRPSTSSSASHSASQAPTDRQCDNCGTTRTPMWRNGPSVCPTLCNACGVRWRSGKAPNLPPPPPVGMGRAAPRGGSDGGRQRAGQRAGARRSSANSSDAVVVQAGALPPAGATLFHVQAAAGENAPLLKRQRSSGAGKSRSGRRRPKLEQHAAPMRSAAAEAVLASGVLESVPGEGPGARKSKLGSAACAKCEWGGGVVECNSCLMALHPDCMDDSDARTLLRDGEGGFVCSGCRHSYHTCFLCKVSGQRREKTTKPSGSRDARARAHEGA